MAEPDGRDDEALPPDDVFALLGNATRMAILRSLWENRDPLAPAAENALSFTDLRERVEMDDPGQFNYHLNRLVGPFVGRSDAGYHLKRPATGIMRAVAIGDLTEDGAPRLTEAADPCPFCGGTVEVRYDQPTLLVRCTSCPGEYRSAVNPEGTLMSSQLFPSMGVEGRDGQTLWETLAIYIAISAFGFLKGVCPECAVAPTTTLDACPDHQGNGICERCGSTQAVLATMVCENCRSAYRFPAWTTAMLHPEVIGFFHERGVEATGGLTLDVYNRFLTAEQVVHSTDPLELEVRVTVDGDELLIGVDGELGIRLES